MSRICRGRTTIWSMCSVRTATPAYTAGAGHERRATGRKGASPTLVVRGSSRLLAAVATRLTAYSAADLATANLSDWRQLRAELARRQQTRVQQRRFRRDPQAYLADLEIGSSSFYCRPSFFRAYAGSGLVIHCLARRQPTPSRLSVARTVSALTNSEVNPSAYDTSAAKPSVHRLVDLPKLRGLWCSRVRKRSACSASKALCWLHLSSARISGVNWP